MFRANAISGSGGCSGSNHATDPDLAVHRRLTRLGTVDLVAAAPSWHPVFYWAGRKEHGARDNRVPAWGTYKALFQLRTCLVCDWLGEKHQMRNKVRVLLRETLIAQNRADEAARVWPDVAVE